MHKNNIPHFIAGCSAGIAFMLLLDLLVKLILSY